jgi:hypothetical protein
MPSTGQERSVDVIRSHVLTPLNVNMQREAELHSLESAMEYVLYKYTRLSQAMTYSRKFAAWQ